MEKDTRGTFRQRFFIDLRAGETNVISWKKLLNKSVVTSTVEEPQAQAQAQDCIGDSKLQKSDLPPPGNRISAVIERIEHLYRGDSSSDEENLDDVPDDDQYDTEDSFIDDEELDEYFSVEKSKTKHSGFFINRGKLERLNEPAPSLVRAPKKSKKKYIKKTPDDRCVERMPDKLLKVGSVCMKEVAKNVPLARLKGANSGWDRALFAGGDTLVHKPSYDQDVEVIQSQGSTFGFGTCKIDKYKGSINKEEVSHTVEVSHKNSVVKDERKPKSVLVRSKDSLVKGVKLLEINDSTNSIRSEKNICHKADSRIRKSNKDASEMATSSQYKITEKEDVDLRVLNSLGDKRSPSKIAHGMGTTKHRKKPLLSAPKEDSIGRPKGSMLERSFQELEKSVAELCPTMMNIQDKGQSSQGAKRRLPTVVKQKLAKVAILVMNQGKISNKLIDRLMNIVGHTIQLNILKRNFKQMIELGKSAKERKDKLQDIRREGAELIKIQLKSKVPERLEDSLDDFQSISISAVKDSSGVPYKWNNATEDFLCEVYKQYLKDVEKAKKKKGSLKTKMDGWNEDWNVAKGSNVNFETIAPYDKQIELGRTHSISVVGGNNLQCKGAKSKLSSITDKKRKYVKSSRKEFKNNNRQPL